MSSFPDKGEPYVCAMCKGEFVSAVDHADAIAESEIIFGDEVSSETHDIVCDECWEILMRKDINEGRA